MREWRALGVTPTGRSLADNEMASLIEPDGPDATAYLLTDQLPGDPRLQLLEFLRDFGRGSGGRDCSAIDRRSPFTSASRNSVSFMRRFALTRHRRFRPCRQRRARGGAASSIRRPRSPI